MGIRKKAKKLASGAGVALATTGLTTCKFGAVDPPPPPFECTTAITEGGTLEATGTRAGTVLKVQIFNRSAQWTAAQVTSVVGGTARPVEPANPLVVVIDLTNEAVTTGSFTLSGTVQGYDGHTCPVTRRFRFALGTDAAASPARPLPGPARHRIRSGWPLVRRACVRGELSGYCRGRIPLTRPLLAPVPVVTGRTEAADVVVRTMWHATDSSVEPKLTTYSV